MKNVKKVIMFLVMLVIISTFSIVYADPNSSKGFAEYDDEQAETETQEMMKEQQKELESAAGKSTNNYLESLQVEGHDMSPEFDKQTMEYVLKGSLNTNKINIIAKPDDETATVQGAGTIQIQDNQKEFRIDVIAESGTVRTYIIYVNEEIQEQEEQKQEELVQPEEPEQQEEVQVDADAESEVKSESNINWIIFIVVIIIVILIIIFFIRKNSNNGKH